MIRFAFRVNRSFLTYPGHPVTIPKSQTDYREVAELVGPSDEVWVSTEGSVPVRGIIYWGNAGFGDYYQLRVRSPMALQAEWLQLGTLVEVLLYRADGRVEVCIRPWNHARGVAA